MLWQKQEKELEEWLLVKQAIDGFYITIAGCICKYDVIFICL
jgi:hypothetical protein